MRPRYLLLVSQDDSLTEHAGNLARSQDLRLCAIVPPLAALVNDRCPCLELGGTGLVLGTLFPRHGPARALSGSEKDRAVLAGSGLQHLLADCWGGYVAVDWRDGAIEILRDPSGALPCYRAQTDRGALFASDIDMLIAGGVILPGVDRDGIATMLGSGGLPTVQTALRGVSMLLPGTSARLADAGQQITTRWSPWDQVGEDPRSKTERGEHLARVVQHSVSSWASLWRRPLISLSGGLDSSIVAACLAASGSDARCVTMYTKDAAGDERRYARDLCRRLNFPLVECRFDLASVDTARPLGLHLPRPIGRAQSQAYERAHLAVAHSESADVFFTGNGGDNVFAYSQSAAALVDRVRAQGWGSGAFRTLRDIAVQTGAGPMRVLGAAWQLSRRPAAYRWKPSDLFLHPELAARSQALELRHPWLDAPVNALHGQAAHIAGLVRVQLNQEPERSLFAPVVNPLLSQPIMEACLAIPSWAWREGGRDRAAARDAFAARLPAAILDRRSKGTPDAFLGQIVRRDRVLLRERLLGGALSEWGLLDREAIERALAPDRLGGGVEDMRLLELANVEAWVSAWRSHLPAPGRPMPHALDETLPSGAAPPLDPGPARASH